MGGSFRQNLKKKAKDQQAGCSTSKPPFKKTETVLCGKKVKPNFSAAQLQFIQRHCFSCSTEFDDSKQLNQHVTDKHSNENFNKKCNICKNMFRGQSGQHEVHYLKMNGCWKSFSDE